MNINRRKNVFTLGDFHFPPSQNAKYKLKERQNADPFERDPFKIQSYNFRYAERPIFPTSPLQENPSNHSSVTDCKTFFYNYNFPPNSNVQRNSVYSDNSAFNLTNFQEYRRKKFLQDQSFTRNRNLINSRPQQNYAQVLKSNYPILAKNDTKLISSQNNTIRNFNIRQNLSHSSIINGNQKVYGENFRSTAESINPQELIKNLTQPMISQTQHKTHQSQASTSLGEGINLRRSLSSGCEININIKSLENESITDNVTIKIETDSIGKNLDMTKPSRLQSSAPGTQQLKHLASSKSFVIDKRLSKFSLNSERTELFRRRKSNFSLQQNLQQQEQKCLKEKQRERIKVLTSVYCPQSEQTATNKSKTQMSKSIDRIPSMIPFRHKSDICINHQYKIENLSPTKKYFLQRVKNNLKSTTKSKLTNDLNSSSTNSLINEKKILNSSLSAAKQSFLKKFNASKHSARSNFTKNPMASLHSLPVMDCRPDQKPISPFLYQNHSKSPVSVNINVFADKFKILRD